MSRHRYRRNRSANLFGGIAVLWLLFYFVGLGRIVFWLSIIALVIFLVWVLSQRKMAEKVDGKNSAELLAPEAKTAMGVEQPSINLFFLSLYLHLLSFLRQLVNS